MQDAPLERNTFFQQKTCNSWQHILLFANSISQSLSLWCMYAAAAVANMLKGVGKGLHEVDSISHKLHLTAKQTQQKKKTMLLPENIQ